MASKQKQQTKTLNRMRAGMGRKARIRRTRRSTIRRHQKDEQEDNQQNEITELGLAGRL